MRALIRALDCLLCSGASLLLAAATFWTVTRAFSWGAASYMDVMGAFGLLLRGVLLAEGETLKAALTAGGLGIASFLVSVVLMVVSAATFYGAKRSGGRALALWTETP